VRMRSFDGLATPTEVVAASMRVCTDAADFKVVNLFPPLLQRNGFFGTEFLTTEARDTGVGAKGDVLK